MESKNKLKMCRLCLCENEHFFSIFEVNEYHGYVAAEVIYDLFQFNVSKGDGYPQFVCFSCLTKLTDYKVFKEMCNRSRVTYDSMFLSDDSLVHHQPEIGEFPNANVEVELVVEEEETLNQDLLKEVKEEPLELVEEDDDYSQTSQDPLGTEGEESSKDGHAEYPVDETGAQSGEMMEGDESENDGKPRFNYEFVASTRGNPLLSHGGYLYHRERTNTSTKVSYYKCTKYSSRRCGGRAVLSDNHVATSGFHNHPPNQTEADVRSTVAAVRRRARECMDTPSNIVAGVVAGQGEELRGALPSLPLLRRTIERERVRHLLST